MEKRKQTFSLGKKTFYFQIKSESPFSYEKEKNIYINVDTTANLLSPTSPLEDPSQDCACGRHRAWSSL